MNEWLFVELNFVPDTLHGIGNSIKQTEINNDNTWKTAGVAKTTVIVVVVIVVFRIIVFILHLLFLLLLLLIIITTTTTTTTTTIIITIIVFVIVLSYRMSSLISISWTIWVQTVLSSLLRYRTVVHKLTYISKTHVVSVQVNLCQTTRRSENLQYGHFVSLYTSRVQDLVARWFFFI